MAKLSEMFMNNINILFYDISNYRDKLKSTKYEFINYSNIRDNTMSILYYKSKGPYTGSSSKPTIWEAFSLIRILLNKCV